MDITDFFKAFVGFIKNILLTLGNIQFTLFGASISLLSFLFVFFVITMVIAIFWRGARF